MSKKKLGYRKEVPPWVGEANENNFVGWIVTILVICLIILLAFIIFGYPQL
jgi:hypothetical protein